MAGYYIDILEPSKDLEKAFQDIGKDVAGLYKEVWDGWKKKHYGDAPFDLSINTFANLWFSKNMKVFVVRDNSTHEALGFLAGILTRPMPYEAMVFQVQEWYVRGGEEMERALFQHVAAALRILGCDEVWVQSYTERKPVLGDKWEHTGDYSISRFVPKR